MGSVHGFLGLFLMIILSSQASSYKFNVGGKDGWVVKPSEGYNHWAERNRFQVNDTLYFRYKKGSDSVLVVKKDHYDSCYTQNPIHKLDGGDSTYKFHRSGPFYFISGKVENCNQGQKLIVVVLSLEHHKRGTPVAPTPVTHSPATAPAPSQPQATSPSQSAPAPETAESPSEGPSAENSPAPSPAHSGSTRFSGSVVVALGFGVALFFA